MKKILPIFIVFLSLLASLYLWLFADPFAGQAQFSGGKLEVANGDAHIDILQFDVGKKFVVTRRPLEIKMINVSLFVIDDSFFASDNPPRLFVRG